MKMSDEQANELKQMQARFDAEPEQLPVNQALKQALEAGVLRMEADKAHRIATDAYYRLKSEIETHLEQDGFDRIGTDCIRDIRRLQRSTRCKTCRTRMRGSPS